MLESLRRHPVWLHDLSKRRTYKLPTLLYATAIAFGSLLLGWGFFAVFSGPWDALFIALTVYVVLMVVSSICNGVQKGFTIVSREQTGRRLEILQAVPLSTGELVWGLFLTAWRGVAEYVLAMSIPLLFGAALYTVTGHPMPLIGGVFALGYLLAFTAFLSAWGILLAVRSKAQESQAGWHGAFGMLAYGGFLFLLNLLPDAPEYVYWLNPVLFLRGLGEYLEGWHFGPQLGLGLFPQAFYALAAILVMGQVQRQWETLRIPSAVRLPGVPDNGCRGPVSYRKMRWAWDPFVADTVNRLLRTWRARPAALLTNFILLTWLCLWTQPTGFFSWIAVMLVFLMWGTVKGGRVVEREKGTARMELLLSTGMAPIHMLRSQVIASLLSLGLAIPFFWACSLFFYPHYHSHPYTVRVPEWESLVLTFCLPVVAAAVGATLGVVNGYRLRISLPMWLRRFLGLGLNEVA